MCGIHGFCWKSGDTVMTAMAGMIETAKHRGPDGSGRWGDARITLGHNLLAISDDVNLSSQPWQTRGHVLVYNGEIYNYRDLRKTLKHEFVTDSDTEVLAAGLEEEGPAFLDRIDGMFALAWYERATGDLLLARDSNGAKPLYYGHLNGRLAFSSEIRSLLGLGFPRKVSKEGFRHYYHAGLVAGRLTMFEGIRKLVPGEVVRTSATTGKWVSTNLNGPVAPFAGNHAMLPGLLREKLKQSVALTATGRRSQGLFLSGGMDSGAILHEMRSKARTFSTRFELPHDRCVHNDDADIAKSLSAAYWSEHREIEVGQAAWVDCLEKSVSAMEEPRQGKSYPAYYACYKLLKDSGITVTHSGDGGDELFLGYKHQHQTPFRLRLEGLRAGHRELSDPGLGITVDEQVDYLSSWIPAGGLTGDAINDFMYVECLHTLSEDFLVRNDKLGAAFGMEARFPMLCRIFRDFARSIPSGMKIGPAVIKGGWSVNNKYLLRKAYAGLLPDQVTKKPKTGWRAPTDDWIIGINSRPAPDGPLRNYIRSALADPVVRELFGIDDDTVENRYLNNRDFIGKPKASGKPGVGVGMASQKELFAVLMFAVWYKSFGMGLW